MEDQVVVEAHLVGEALGLAGDELVVGHDQVVVLDEGLSLELKLRQGLPGREGPQTNTEGRPARPRLGVLSSDASMLPAGHYGVKAIGWAAGGGCLCRPSARRARAGRGGIESGVRLSVVGVGARSGVGGANAEGPRTSGI